MSVECRFVDTNVFVYLFDADAPDKKARARELLREEKDRIVLSAQVLGEFYVTVTRKLAAPLSPEAALRALNALCRFEVQSITSDMVRSAVHRSQSMRLSYWDSLILESALGAGADVLFSEDFQDGQEIGDLRVVNPFRNVR